MGKGLYKGFKIVVKDISQEMTPLVESGSEVSHFIPESRNFDEVEKLSDNKKTLAKVNPERYKEYNKQSDFPH